MVVRLLDGGRSGISARPNLLRKQLAIRALVPLLRAPIVECAVDALLGLVHCLFHPGCKGIQRRLGHEGVCRHACGRRQHTSSTTDALARCGIRDNGRFRLLSSWGSLIAPVIALTPPGEIRFTFFRPSAILNRGRRPKLTRQSPLPSKCGSLAMLAAMRRASSSVSTLAIWASFGFSHE